MVATLDQTIYQALYAKPRQRSAPKQDKRCRYQVRFWLDITKDAEYAIAEQVEGLKKSRMFTSTVREGLELVFSLQHRKIDVLERLFPWVSEHYRAKYTAGQGDLAARLAALEAKLAALDTAPAPTLQPVTPRPTPPDDDDGDLLRITKAAPNADTASARSFLDSAFSLQS